MAKTKAKWIDSETAAEGTLLTAQGDGTALWQPPKFDPERTLFVSPSGTEYSTIGAAIAAANALTPTSSDPVCIVVFPGTYNEDSLTLPSYCNMVCQAPLGSAVIEAATGTNTIITMSSNATISGFFVRGADGEGGVGISVPSGETNVVIDKTLMNDNATHIKVAGSGTPFSAVVNVVDLLIIRSPGQVGGTGIHVTNGGFVSGVGYGINGTPTATIGTGILVDGGLVRIAGSTIQYCATGIDVKGGGDWSSTGVNVNNCTTGISVDGSTTKARFNSNTITDCTTDLALSNNPVGFYNGYLDTRKSNDIDDASTFFLQTFSDTAGDDGLKIVGEFHVGRLGRPSEACFGEGDSSTIDMTCLTNTNGEVGTWADVTTELSSEFGSTADLFPGTGAGNCFYVGQPDRAFPGIKVEGISPAMVGGEVTCEYWNGSAWTELPCMETKSNSPYTQNGDDILREAYSVQIRFNNVDDWTTKILNGTSAYWFRIRIVTAVTTIPAAERVKYHVNRTEINSDGTIEHFGLAEPSREIPLAGLRPIQSFYAGQRALNASPETYLVFNYNERDHRSKEGSGSFFTLPEGIDTSKPIIFHVLWAVESTDTGDVHGQVNLTSVGPGTVLDGSVPKLTSNVITTATAGSAHRVFEEHHEFLVPDALPGDRFLWSQIRDASNGNPDDTLQADTYLVAWRVTATFWR